MRSILVAGLMATALLAGCTSPSGETAQDAFSVARREAESRYADAKLVGAFGLEFNAPPMEEGAMDMAVEGDSDEAKFMAALMKASDDSIGDGHAPAWGFGFVSFEARQIVAVAVVDGAVEFSFETPIPEQFHEDTFAGDQAENWNVDSAEAMETLRASNATLDAAIEAGNMTSVRYALDLEDQAWEIEGFAEGLLTFDAKVSIQEPTIQKLVVKEGGKPTPPVQPEPEKILPEPIHEEGTFLVSLDPLNFIGLPVCSTPTADCVAFPFTVEGGKVGVDAVLSWDVPLNDLDLYIFQDGTEVAASNVAPPSDQESISETLSAGDYTVVVVGWSAVGESWSLDVEFS